MSAIPRHLVVAAAVLPVMRREPEAKRSVGSLAAEFGLRKRDILPGLGALVAKGYLKKKGDKLWITEAGIKAVDDNKPEEEKRANVVRASALTAEEIRKIEREAGLK